MEETSEPDTEEGLQKANPDTVGLCDDIDLSNISTGNLSLDSSMFMQGANLPLLNDGELVTASPEDITAVLSSIEQSDTGGETGADTGVETGPDTEAEAEIDDSTLPKCSNIGENNISHMLSNETSPISHDSGNLCSNEILNTEIDLQCVDDAQNVKNQEIDVISNKTPADILDTVASNALLPSMPLNKTQEDDPDIDTANPNTVCANTTLNTDSVSPPVVDSQNDKNQEMDVSSSKLNKSEVRETFLPNGEISDMDTNENKSEHQTEQQPKPSVDTHQTNEKTIVEDSGENPCNKNQYLVAPSPAKRDSIENMPASVISDNMSERSFCESVVSDVSGLPEEKKKKSRRKRRRDSQKFDVGKASFQPVVLLEDVMKSDIIHSLNISGWCRRNEPDVVKDSKKIPKKRQKTDKSDGNASDDNITYELGSETLLVCNKAKESKKAAGLFQANFSSDEDDTRHLDNLNKALEAIIGKSSDNEDELEVSKDSFYNISPSKTKLLQNILTESDSDSSFEGFSDSEIATPIVNEKKSDPEKVMKKREPSTTTEKRKKSDDKEKSSSTKKPRLDANKTGEKSVQRESAKKSDQEAKNRNKEKLAKKKPIETDKPKKSETESKKQAYQVELKSSSSGKDVKLKVDLSLVKTEKHDPGYEATEMGHVKTSVVDNLPEHGYKSDDDKQKEVVEKEPISFTDIKGELKYFQSKPPPKVNLETMPKKLALCVRKIAKQHPNVIKECIVCVQKVTPRQISKLLSLKHRRDDDANIFDDFFKLQSKFVDSIKQDRESEAPAERKHAVKSKEYISDSGSESDELPQDEHAYQPVQIIEMAAEETNDDLATISPIVTNTESEPPKTKSVSSLSSSSDIDSDSSSVETAEVRKKEKKLSHKKSKAKQPSSDVAHFLQRRDEERTQKTKRKEMLEKLRDAKLQAKKLSYRSDSDDVDSDARKEKEPVKKAELHPLNPTFGLQTFKIPKKVKAKDGTSAKPQTKAAMKSLPPIPKSEMSRREEFEYKYAGWRKTDKNDEIPRRFPMGPKSRTVDNPKWKGNQRDEKPSVNVDSKSGQSSSTVKTERRPEPERKRNVYIPDKSSMGSSKSILDTLLPVSKPGPASKRQASSSRDAATKTTSSTSSREVKKQPEPTRDISEEEIPRRESNEPVFSSNITKIPKSDVEDSKPLFPELIYTNPDTLKRPLLERPRPLLERPQALLPTPSNETRPKSRWDVPVENTPDFQTPSDNSPAHIPVYPPIPVQRPAVSHGVRQDDFSAAPPDFSPMADTPESDGDDYNEPAAIPEFTPNPLASLAKGLTPNFKADASRLEQLNALTKIVEESKALAMDKNKSITMPMEDFVNVLTIQKNLENQIKQLTQMKEGSVEKTDESQETSVKTTPQPQPTSTKSPTTSETSIAKQRERGDKELHRRHSRESSSSHSSKHAAKSSSARRDGKERSGSHHSSDPKHASRRQHQDHKKREGSGLEKHRSHREHASRPHKERENDRSHKDRETDRSKQRSKSDQKHSKYADYLDNIEFAPSPKDDDPDLELNLPSPDASPGKTTEIKESISKSPKFVIPTGLSNYGIDNAFTSFLGAGKSTKDIFSNSEKENETGSRVEEADSTVNDQGVSTLEQKLLDLKREVEQVADDDEKMQLLEERMLSLRNELIREESRSKSSSPVVVAEQTTTTVTDSRVSTVSEAVNTTSSVQPGNPAFVNTFATATAAPSESQVPVHVPIAINLSVPHPVPPPISAPKPVPPPPSAQAPDLPPVPPPVEEQPAPPPLPSSEAEPLPVLAPPPLPLFAQSSVDGYEQPWAQNSSVHLFLPPPPPPPDEPPAPEPTDPMPEEMTYHDHQEEEQLVPSTHCEPFLTTGQCHNRSLCKLVHRVPTDWPEENTIHLLNCVIPCGTLDDIMEVYLSVEKRNSKLTEVLLLGMLSHQEHLHMLFGEAHIHQFAELVNDMCTFSLLTPGVVETIILFSKEKGLAMQEKVWQLWECSATQNFELSSEALDVLCETFMASQTYQRLWKVVEHSSKNQGYIPADQIIYMLLKLVSSCNVQHILNMMEFFEQLPLYVMDRLNQNLVDSSTPKVHFLRRGMLNCIINTCTKNRWDMLGRLFIKLVLAATPIPWCYTELIAKQLINNNCLGFRPFIQVLEDKFEELQHCAIKGEIARIGATVVQLCKTEQNYKAGFTTLLVLKEFRIPFFKAEGVWVIPSAVLAMGAVEICLEIGKPVEAFDVLDGSNFCCRSQDESVELTGQRLFLIQRTLLQLFEQGHHKEACALFTDLIHHYEREKQVVFDYDDVIDVSWFYNKLQFQAIEASDLESALSVYKCNSLSSNIRSDSLARRCLLTACVKAGNMKKISRELLTDAFRDGSYPQQSLFNEPRSIRLMSNMTQEEMYIVINMYLVKLYEHLCSHRRQTGTQLTPRDTSLAVIVEGGSAAQTRNLTLLNVSNTLHDASLRVMEVLEMQMKPPIECMQTAKTGLVQVVPDSLYRHFQRRETEGD